MSNENEIAIQVTENNKLEIKDRRKNYTHTIIRDFFKSLEKHEKQNKYVYVVLEGALIKLGPTQDAVIHGVYKTREGALKKKERVMCSKLSSGYISVLKFKIKG